jgi:hypothetical protein
MFMLHEVEFGSLNAGWKLPLKAGWLPVITLAEKEG